LQVDDRSAAYIELAPSAPNEQLGAGVLACLAASRHLSTTQASQLRAEVEQRYALWIEELMSRHQYRRRADLFRHMRSVDAESESGVITFSPTHHDQLEGWNADGITEEMRVRIALTSEASMIGQGLRLALSRCI